MENLIGRYRNVSILMAVLFAQIVGLGVQVRRSSDLESSRLIRIWVVSAVSPLEKAFVFLQNGGGNLWHNYFYLRGVRQENRDLKAEIERLRLEQVRLSEDAEQARRLQALLGFKEQFIAQTVAAQVIGSSGSEQSRSIYIDKGTSAGIEKDMAVITADGVIGKVLRVYPSTSQVLLINDQSSGVGAILEKSRLQGVLKGTAMGEVVLEKVMSDEVVQPGERVLTSGGDQIFPKGLPVGMVTRVSSGADLFLHIRLRPAANLSRLEEVLVIARKEERAPSVAEAGSARAVDILAQRLPSVPDKPAGSAGTPGSGAAQASPPSPPGTPNSQPAVSGKPEGKPATTQKTAPPPLKVSEPATRPAGGGSKPASVKPKPPQSTLPAQTPQPQAEPARSEDKPQ